MNNEVGENIMQYRKVNGMTQKHLAKLLGISVQGLLKIEKGQVSPKVETLEKFMDILCITPNQLFGLEPVTEDNVSILARLKKIKEAPEE